MKKLVLSLVLMVVGMVAAEREASAITISSGSDSTCMVDTWGGLWCWGNNSQGQLGTGNTVSFPTPRQVVGSGWSSVSVGHQFACGIREGNVYCWGANSSGQLGNGTTTWSSVPVAVAISLTGTDVAVTAGFAHACAITSAGTPLRRYTSCWGSNSHYQIGDPTIIGASSLTPRQVGWWDGVYWTPFTALKIAAGNRHTCGISEEASTVYCWGDNEYGQIAGGRYLSAADSPRCVSADIFGNCYPGGFIAQNITAGKEHSCASRGGYVYCWGHNNHGQLGHGDVWGVMNQSWYNVSLEQPVIGVNAVAAPSSGADADHTCGLSSVTSTVFCWGRNDLGQVGDGTTTDRLTAVAVFAHGGEGTAGGGHSCTAWTESTTVVIHGRPYKYLTDRGRCWGRNVDGELGTGDWSNRTTPAAVTGY